MSSLVPTVFVEVFLPGGGVGGGTGISSLIPLGIGTPGDIPSFLLFGLTANPSGAPSGDGNASLIPLGIGTPGSIPAFLLFGLSSGASEDAADWVNLIADVQCEDGIHIERGIRASGPADLVAGTGTAQFSLRNDSGNSASTLGYYSPYHASKRLGWGLNIPCRIRITDPATAITRTHFRGTISEIAPVPGTKLSRKVLVTAVDWLDTAATVPVMPAIGEQVNKRANEILAAILAQMAVPPTAVILDAGLEVYPFALAESVSGKQAVLTELAKIAASEHGLVYVTGDGTLRFENRHARINSVSAWTVDGLAMADQEDGLTIPTSITDIKNTIRVTTHQRLVDDLANSVVYEQTNPIRIEAGETKLLLGPFRDTDTGDPIGATEVELPLVPSMNYLFNADQHGGGVDLTADLTVTPTIGAAGASFSLVNAGITAGWLTRLRVYGKAIKDHGTTDHEATDEDSVAAYGEHVALVDMPYQSDIDVGQAAATFLLGRFGVPVANTILVRGKNPALLTQLLTREVSDRITVQEEVTGIDDDFMINGMALTVMPTGHVEATYHLTPTNDPPAGGYWVLGTSVLGTNTTPAPF